MGSSANGEGEEEEIKPMYFLYLCENRTMELVEMILSRGEGREGE
jgi:hypothetical protein